MIDRRPTIPAGHIGSALFVPGDDERKLANGFDAGAALAIADLEDAVAEAAKPAARDTVATALVRRASDGGRCAVRINALDGPFAADDLAMVADAGVDAVVVPKARAASLRELDPAGVLRVDGEVVDVPVYERALDVLGGEFRPPRAI